MAEWLRTPIFSPLILDPILLGPSSNLVNHSSHITPVGSCPAQITCERPSSACRLSVGFSIGYPDFVPPYD